MPLNGGRELMFLMLSDYGRGSSVGVNLWGLNAPVWWYLYRTTEVFVKTRPDWVTRSAACPPPQVSYRTALGGELWSSPKATGGHRLPIDGAAINTYGGVDDLSGYEMFTSDGEVPDVFDLSWLTREEKRSLSALILDLYLTMAISMSISAYHDLITVLPDCDLVADFTYAVAGECAFLPLPVGFFDALEAKLLEPGFMPSTKTTTVGTIPGVLPLERFSFRADDIDETPRDGDELKLMTVFGSDDFLYLVKKVKNTRGLDQAWLDEQLADVADAKMIYRSLVGRDREEELYLGPVVTALFLAWRAPLVKAVTDYYASDELMDAMPLSWYLRLNGIEYATH